MNKMSGVRLACHSFFVRAEHKKQLANGSFKLRLLIVS